MDDAVFRGMPVDAAPLRLRRRLPVASVAAQEEPAGARAELAYREAVSAGFDEGLRQGREAGKAAGHEEGLRSGRQEAQQQAAEEVERAVAAATEALAQERARLHRIVQSGEEIFVQLSSLAEDEMVALCYETICRMVGAAGIQPDGVRAVLGQAVAAARESPQVLLLVHPADAELIDRVDLPNLPGQALAWRGDPSISLGGCIAKTASGGLDMRLETLLDGCKAALLQARLEHDRADAQESP